MFKNETRTADVPRVLGCDVDTERPGLVRGCPGGLSQREGQAGWKMLCPEAPRRCCLGALLGVLDPWHCPSAASRPLDQRLLCPPNTPSLHW